MKFIKILSKPEILFKYLKKVYEKYINKLCKNF